MMRGRTPAVARAAAAVAVALAALPSGACASAPPRAGSGTPGTARASASPEATALAQTYIAYVKAVQADDLAGARRYLAQGKLRENSGLTDREALSQLDVVSPLGDITAYDARIDGDEATLVVAAKAAENDATGVIGMVREAGEWKILTVLYDIGGAPDASSLNQYARPAGLTAAQKAAWRTLNEKGFPRPDKDYLVMTAREGRLDLVKLLLEAGFPIDSRDNTTETALIAAARAGRAEVALYLIEAGADVNAASDINMTPLLAAAEQCHMTDVLRVLLSKGARADARTAGGATPVEMADSCTANAELLRAAAASSR
jgi:hypothetical protein